MIKNLLKGFYFGIGLFLFIGILFGLVLASGWHPAGEITSGSFIGTFDFSGATVTGLSSGGVLIDSSLVCNSTNQGNLNFNSSKKTLEFCDGVNWEQIKKISKKSCKDILNSGESIGDGLYEIDPDGEGSKLPFNVYCDMTTDGGGWTRLAHFTSTTLTIDANTYTNGLNFVGDSDYVIQCSKFTDLHLDTIMMKTDFSGNYDYFKPSENNDLCTMLGDYRSHLWSSSWDGAFVAPPYYTGHLGGSVAGFPTAVKRVPF